MKIDMSPKAIENRLKLVGELTKACLLIRQNILSKTNEKSDKKIEFKIREFNKKGYKNLSNS